MIIRIEDGWKGSRLNEYTGDSTCFRKAFKEAGIKAGSATGTITIDGEKYKIKAWQLQDLRTVKARWLAAKTKELISSGEYKSLSKKAKQQKLRSLNSKATNYAKNWYKEKYL